MTIIWRKNQGSTPETQLGTSAERAIGLTNWILVYAGCYIELDSGACTVESGPVEKNALEDWKDAIVRICDRSLTMVIQCIKSFITTMDLTQSVRSGPDHNDQSLKSEEHIWRLLKRPYPVFNLDCGYRKMMSQESKRHSR